MSWVHRAAWPCMGLSLLALLGSLVQNVGHFSGTVALAEGQPFDGQVSSYLNASTVHAGEAPNVPFEPVRIEPIVDGDAIVGIDATVRLGSDTSETPLSDSEPARVDGAQLSVLTLGLAPVFAVTDHRTGTAAGMCVNLDVWAEGAPADAFPLDAEGTTAFVRYFPDYVDIPGGPATRSLVPRNERIEVTVRGKDVGTQPVTAVLAPGGRMGFGPYEVRLLELRRWGMFQVAVTPWFDLRLVAAGLLALSLLLGVVARLTPPPTRLAHPEPEAST